MQNQVKIRPAIFPEDKDTTASLFRAFEASVPVKLDFQGFEEEVAGLPSKYAVEKGGAIYLAYEEPTETNNPLLASTEYKPSSLTPIRDQVIGCVAIRPFPAPVSPLPPQCELKRLYLAPASRGRGVARLLMDSVIARARQLGYKEVLLDTLASMTAARRLYENCGFELTGAYYESVEGAVFYKLVL
jgi:ribosomal protein S18 acetylase RimI-like enzyme